MVFIRLWLPGVVIALILSGGTLNVLTITKKHVVSELDCHGMVGMFVNLIDDAEKDAQDHPPWDMHRSEPVCLPIEVADWVLDEPKQILVDPSLVSSVDLLA